MVFNLRSISTGIILISVAAILLALSSLHFAIVPKILFHPNRSKGSIKSQIDDDLLQNEGNVFSFATRLKFKKILNVAFYFNILPVDVGGNIMEYEWIVSTLLARIDRPIRIFADRTLEKIPRNDTLHVYLFNPSPNLFVNLSLSGFVNQGAYHMGDESMKNDISYYRTASYVFRNYYNAEYLALFQNVHFAPLGMKSGFGSISYNGLLPSSQRRYIVNFIGSLRSNRGEMIDTIKRHNISALLSYEHGWASKEGLHPISYRNVLLESMFTLAPWGNNPESLRLYEAMEAGSIPIFQRCLANRNPLVPMGVNNPIPQFDSWNEAAEFIVRMQKDAAAVDILQGKITSFWRVYKKKIQMQFKNVIDAAFRHGHGYSC